MSLVLLLGSLLLQGQTRYAVQAQNGREWLTGRDGKPFLSFGVCVVDPGVPPAQYKADNPAYSALRFYPNSSAWAKDTLSRLQSWGFNTIGAWSDYPDLHQQKTNGLYFMPILHMGSSAGAPWKDMWDPSVVSLMERIAWDQISKMRSDPRVVGYFSDNEMGWWEAALFDWGWKAPAGSGTRAHLVDSLTKHYSGRWDRLLKDFQPVKAKSFAELHKQGRLYLNPGGAGMQAVQEYIGVLADRYYSLCRSIIRRYDGGALFLGDRYISNFYPEVARAAGKYVDVLSTNLNADWNDGSFARFYLPSLEAIAKKPILISEYYMASAENRTGNKNDSSGFPVAPTQVDRAARFTDSTRYFFSKPYVVGAHWFQYYDEPKHGRGDGENYDMGLVDVQNEPYAEITAASKSDWTQVHGNPQVKPLDVTDGVPRTPSGDPDLNRWPSSSYVPPTGASTRADLYMAWNEDSLSLAYYWNEDRFGEAFYANGKVPAEDRARASIEIDGRKFQAVMGEGGQPKVTGGASVVLSKTGVRNTVVLSFPASSLGALHLQDGDTINLRLSFSTRARAYKAAWIGSYKLVGPSH